MAPALKMMHDIIHWKYPVLSFFVWVGVVGGVYTFEPWMITAALPPVLIMGRIAPGLFIKHKGKSFLYCFQIFPFSKRLLTTVSLR